MEFLLMSSNVVGGTSTILNGSFFIFIVLYPPKNLGRYKKYYFLGAFSSFIFAFAHCLCAFSFYSDGSFFLSLSIRRTGKYVFYLFLFAYNALFIIIAYNFWQRYGLISNNKWFGDPRLKLLYCSYKTMQLFITTVPISVILYPDDSIRRIVSGVYGKSLMVDFAEDHFHAISHVQPLFGTETANEFAYLSFLHFGAENIATMLISGLRIYRFIAAKSRSNKLRVLNQRLLRTLTLQALFSLLLIYMPGLICTTAMYLRINVSHASPYVSSLMACGTLFNPIADVILTSEYRQKMSQLLRRQTKSSATLAVAFTSVGPSKNIK